MDILKGMEKELMDALNSGTYFTYTLKAQETVQKACKKICKIYYPKDIHAFTVGGAHEIDDVENYVLDCVLSKYCLFNPNKGNIEAFIRGITKNYIIDIQRSDKRFISFQLYEMGEDDINSFSASYVNGISSIEIGENFDSEWAIKQICEVAEECLSNTELKVFNVWKDGGKVRDIAAELGMTSQQATKLIYKLRNKLKEQLLHVYPEFRV